MIKKNDGFTVLELMIVIVVLLVLAAILIPNFPLIQQRTELNNGVQEFVGVLKSAQNRALASDANSQYGVYIDTSVSPHKYVLFKGASYAVREQAYDQNYFLSNNVEFYAISLGGGNEIFFNKLTGSSQQSGSVSLRSKIDNSQNKTVYIANSGVIGFVAPSSASDEARIKDSRHVHFDYSRIINTSTENIVLTFDGTIVKVIPVNAYLAGGEFNWEGTVNTASSDQTVRVHTHRLNNPDTQFSVTRDKRFNDKTFKITISGDSFGSLIEYSADGATVNGLTSADCSSGATGLSSFVSNCSWQ